MGVSQNWGYLLRGPYDQEHRILGSILGSPYFGKLPSLPSIRRQRSSKYGVSEDVYSQPSRPSARALMSSKCVIRQDALWVFPKISGTLLGVSIIRTIVFGGLY